MLRDFILDLFGAITVILCSMKNCNMNFLLTLLMMLIFSSFFSKCIRQVH